MGLTLAKKSYETTEYLNMLTRLIKRAGVRAGEADEVELRQLIELSDVLAEAIQTAVDGQRARGRSWQQIADATPYSKVNAFQRWGKKKAPTSE